MQIQIIGAPEQEFRQLYRINNLVLECAVKKYNQLSGLNINISAVKNWAIMQELAVYAEKVKWKDFTHRSFARASKNLNKWLPQGKWNEVSKSNIDI